MGTITARQRVLAIVRRRKVATASQIGQALNMSAATVRHHLSILTGDGRLVSQGSIVSTRRGRPQKVYRLSERVLGDNFALLAEGLLETYFGQMTEAELQTAVQALAATLSDHIGRPDSSLPAPKRLVQLIEKLSTLHYEAGWEAGAHGPRVVLGHCPYAAIIARHPELCRMDAAMLGRQLDAEAVQLSKIEPGRAGSVHCVFELRAGGTFGD